MTTPVPKFITLLCVFALQSLALQAEQTLNVAAAADLIHCLDELNADFQKSHPTVKLKTSTGASGSIFAQIKNGAPFDVFLSADVTYPKELIKAGLADANSLQLYAIGHLVVWSTTKDVDVANGIASLKIPAIRKVAIANPDHAPYGRAAKAAIEHHDLWETLKDKIVYGENVAQTAHFVETGNAEAGIVALSLVRSPKLITEGRWVEIPESSYPRLEQAAILTNKGASNPAAVEYLAFLRSPAARSVLDRYGFVLPSQP